MTEDTDNRLGTRIRQAREQRRWSQSDLANVARTNQATVDRLERGETKNSKYLAAILKALNLNAGERPRVPLVGYIGAGEQVIPIDDHALGDGIDFVEVPPGLENAIALQIRGDSMSPKYDDGDVVIVDKVYVDVQSLVGRICYVKLTDGRCFLKRLRLGGRPGRFTLQSLNAADILEVSIEQAFPIAWTKPKG
jgi:phage repressor protein C with HTH and peptisase S24 domain